MKDENDLLEKMYLIFSAIFFILTLVGIIYLGSEL